VVGGWWLSKLIWFTPVNINHFYDRIFVRYGISDPQLLSRLRILERFGLNFHNDDLTDSSDAFLLKHLKKAESELKILRSYKRSKQTPSQLLTTDMLTWFLELILEGRSYIHNVYAINPLFGTQNELPAFMIQIHPLKGLRDARYYLVRLSKFKHKFHQILRGLETRAQKGIYPPKVIIDSVVRQMKAFIASPPEKNVLYTHFSKKITPIKMSPQRRQEFHNLAKKHIENAVYPSYRKLITHFKRIRPKAPTAVGLWKQPNGPGFYRFLLKLFTTTEYTPEQLHQLGLKEVKRIQSLMSKIFAKVGIKGPFSGALLQKLSKQSRFLYPNNDRGRRQCIEDYKTIVAEMRKQIPKYFDLEKLDPLDIKRTPIFKEQTAPGAQYLPPAMDGSRPGIFYANLRDMRNIPKFGMRTLAYHEAIPGHHLQLATQFQLKGVPIFRKVAPFTGFIEGWGLYAETLAWEMGFHKTPYDRIGRLQAELFRAVRLVVDTGMHHKRWSRQQAIQYMQHNTGMARKDVITEIDRYIVLPGQACAYKVGEIALLKLRRKAKKALGKQFNLKAFHTQLLKNGAVPLIFLERIIDAYINKEKGL